MSDPITQGYKVQFYHSTSFDSLVDTWIDNYQKRILHRPPLLPETVIVHSHAMAQHLNKTLTQKLGVTALINYLLPTAFENQVRNFLLHHNNLPVEKKTYSGDNPFDPICLRWIIYSLITNPKYKKSIRNLPVMGNYLFNKKKSEEEELSHLKAFQLAYTMANLFNEYLFFREDMLWEWDSNLIEESPDKIQWQKWLWQIIRQHIDHPHRLEELEKIKKILKNNSLESIREQNASSLIFPDHISVFAISFLPNYYLELFNNLKKIITIDYYYPDSTHPLLIPNSDTGNSSPHIDRPLFIEKLSELSIAYQESIEKLHWNSISLPSYKKKQLQPHDTQPPNSWDLLNYIKSFCTTSLNLSQLSEKNTSSNSLPNQPPFPDFQVHKCYNRRREVEAVKTQILLLLEKEPHLTLDQILILSPDILDYQDYLESVFTCEPSIPYHVIDRNENHNNSIIKAILTILDLFNSEWELSKVKEIFSLNLIRSSWKWEEVDILFFEEWINHIGVKRGRGQDSSSQHFDLKKYSWRKGIHRIMFSYTLLAPNNEKIYFDETPITGKLHGDEAQNLGEMVYLLQKLLDYDSKFQAPTNFLTWLDRIQKLTHEIIYFNQQEYLYHFREQKDHSRFIDQIKKIGEQIAFASKSLESSKNKNLNECTHPIDLYTFTKILQQNLNETEHVTTGTHYGVTCGSLLPLRIIPSEITFMLGMGRDDFPRHDRNAHINLVLQNPRPSDRTKKKGDQLLFIETIFSTNRYLGITYSPPPDSGVEEVSPSIIVDELLLFLTSQSGIKNLRKLIIQEHPLLPFPISPPLSTNTKTTNPKQITLPEKDKPAPSYYRYSFDPEDHRNALALYQQTQNPTTPSTNSIFNKTTTALKTVNLVLQHFSHTQPTFSSTPLKQEPSYEFLSHLNQIWTQGIQSLKLLTSSTTSNHLKENKENNSSQEIVVKLYDLIFFFNNAPRFFLNKILKINLETDEVDVNDQEPLILNPLQKYQIISEKIKEQLAQPVLKADTLEENFLSSTSVIRDPLFPAGEPGNNQVDLMNLSLGQVNQNLNLIKSLIIEALGNFPSTTTTINIEKTLVLPQKWDAQTLTSSYKFANKKINFKLEGYIKDVFLIKNNKDTENPIVRHNLLCRYLKITPWDIINAWFEHLFLHLDEQSPAVTWLIGEEEFFFFVPLSSSSLKNPIKKNQVNNGNFLHRFLNSLISCYLIGHALPLPIYREMLDHFHKIQFKKIIAIDKKETINTLAKPILPSFSLEDQKEENQLTFETSDLHPSIEKNPYAHYLWGENNYSNESLSSETVVQFSEFYQLLWYSVYQHLRKVDL